MNLGNKFLNVCSWVLFVTVMFHVMTRLLHHFVILRAKSSVKEGVWAFLKVLLWYWSMEPIEKKSLKHEALFFYVTFLTVTNSIDLTTRCNFIFLSTLPTFLKYLLVTWLCWMDTCWAFIVSCIELDKLNL